MAQPPLQANDHSALSAGFTRAGETVVGAARVGWKSYAVGWFIPAVVTVGVLAATGGLAAIGWGWTAAIAAFASLTAGTVLTGGIAGLMGAAYGLGRGFNQGSERVAMERGMARAQESYAQTIGALNQAAQAQASAPAPAPVQPVQAPVQAPVRDAAPAEQHAPVHANDNLEVQAAARRGHAADNAIHASTMETDGRIQQAQAAGRRV